MGDLETGESERQVVEYSSGDLEPFPNDAGFRSVVVDPVEPVGHEPVDIVRKTEAKKNDQEEAVVYRLLLVPVPDEQREEANGRRVIRLDQTR